MSWAILVPILSFLPPKIVNSIFFFGNFSYFHCSLIGYFLGLLTATVSSEVFKAAQPALLYLVPFTLLPLLTMAYLKVIRTDFLSVRWCCNRLCHRHISKKRICRNFWKILVNISRIFKKNVGRLAEIRNILQKFWETIEKLKKKKNNKLRGNFGKTFRKFRKY